MDDIDNTLTKHEIKKVSVKIETATGKVYESDFEFGKDYIDHFLVKLNMDSFQPEEASYLSFTVTGNEVFFPNKVLKKSVITVIKK